MATVHRTTVNRSEPQRQITGRHLDLIGRRLIGGINEIAQTQWPCWQFLTSYYSQQTQHKISYCIYCSRSAHDIVHNNKVVSGKLIYGAGHVDDCSRDVSLGNGTQLSVAAVRCRND